MTLARFVGRNALRNKRRSLLTILSVAFPLLLLSFLMSVWRVFYIDQGAARAAQRLFVRHKIFLASFIPIHYADKIRTVPGVVHVIPLNWFGGIYKDRRPENFFGQFGTYPDEFFETFTELSIAGDQKESWKRDPAGAVADIKLARKHGWKIGDRIVIQGDPYPVKLELTLRGLFTSALPNDSLYFNWKYVEEGLSWVKGNVGVLTVLVDSPEHVGAVSAAIDRMLSNAPEPTKTETERAFALEFISMLGNVKTFILVISLAAIFTILLVSGNTMAMSIRERTREVAMLKTLGFQRRTILELFVGEAVAMAVLGGVIGTIAVLPILLLLSGVPQIGGVFSMALHDWKSTAPVVWAMAALAGLFSSVFPAMAASRTRIVDGLRFIG